MKTPTIDEMHEMFRARTEAALNVIVDIMTNGTGAKGEATRLAAAKEILNRGWGRPTAHKEKDKDAAPPEDPWRSADGRTYKQVYADKVAEVAAQAAAKAAAAAAQQPESAAVPVPSEPAPAVPPTTAAPPLSRTPTPPSDPTGYIARRALWSASPPPQNQRGNGAAPNKSSR